MPDQPELRQRLIDALTGPFAEPDADTAVDVLLSLPGVAIVELPEAIRNWWPVVHGGEPEQVYLAHEPNDGEQIIAISGTGYCYVNEARAVAAALLAAADAAEGKSDVAV